MKRQPASLAKTTRPRLPGLLQRRRLFGLLDQARKRPLVWITGPPGSGKTTLVASYIEARKLAGLWYQVDAGDTDIAAFFSYMREAAKTAAPGRRRPLPLLTPEYWLKLSVFSRRYFRDLCSRMRPPFVIVFDNYSELPSYSRLHDVLGEGLGEIPKAGCVIIISRDQPPSSMARFRAGNLMTIVGAEKLRLTLEEAKAITRLRAEAKPATEIVRHIHRKTRGWAAGLVLMLEGKSLEELRLQDDGGADSTAVFDYFAGEIFQKESPKVQEFLLKTAFLGKMTAPMAAQLTGSTRADRILAELNRRNFFTERRFRSAPVYQYHPLFREFLMSRAKGTIPPTLLRGVQARAAALLAEAQYVEDAAGLLREIEDWEGMGRLILEQASSMIAQGRTMTLEQWLGSLPNDILERRAWLQYWLGSCRLVITPAQSRGHFEKAFHLFEAQADLQGLLSSWCGVVGSILYEWGDFTRLDQWIARLREIMTAHPLFPSPEIEARVACDMFGALMFRQPDDPEIDLWARRALSLSLKSTDINRRLLTAVLLTLYHLWMGDLARAAVVIDSVRELEQSQSASPLVQIAKKLIDIYYQWHAGPPEVCLKTVSEALQLARNSGVHVWNTLLLAQGAAACLSSGDQEAARSFLRNMIKGLEASRLLNVSQYHYLAAWEAVLRDDLPVALEHTEVALRLATEMGTPFPQALNHLSMAQLLHEREKADEAACHLAKALAIARRVNSGMLQFMGFLTKAHMALDGKDRAGALESLRRAMSLGRERGYINTSWWRRSVMARLCTEALAAGIEVQYVQRLVRKRTLVPDTPPLHVEQWPWPLRVYTLGEFRLVRDDQPLRFSRKVQQKPLAMLRAIIAFGGRDVPQEQLADALWPEAEGDAALRAFATTLHRLRQVAGSEKVVQLQGGLVGLDPRFCWVDSWAFESFLAQAGAAEKRGEMEAAAGLAGKALNLYRGAFLAGGNLPSWALSTSERLRGLFLRHTGKLGAWEERTGNWRKAVECYEKALEIDDLAEDFYQRLMSCYLQLGRRAEGLAVYERCRKVLAARLGIDPSPETESLRLALRQQ